MHRNVLIIFPYTNLAYSPSVINLYDVLAEEHEVRIVAFAPFDICSTRLDGRNVEYVPFDANRLKLANRVARVTGWFGIKFDGFAWVTALAMRKALREAEADVVIAVDFTGAWAALQRFPRVHLLSLEIVNDWFTRHLDRSRLESVIVQSEPRYAHLFPRGGVKRFLVQNAPIYTSQPNRPKRNRSLLFCGTAIPGFGIYHCLRFLDATPGFTLTVQGFVTRQVREVIDHDYAHLLREGRLTLNDEYLERTEIIPYLSQFEIGLCCYDTSLPEFNTINYRTAPSGKLFNYYAAGVPVVGSRLPGLDSVEIYGTGVLIAEFSVPEITRAIETIHGDYARMSANCLVAAEAFSFDRALEPFRKFLRAGGKDAATELRKDGRSVSR